jgi:hypothetical protein
MQNLFFIFPLTLIAFVIITVVLFIRNKRKLVSGYDMSKPAAETILVSPFRLTMLAVILMGLGGLFLFIILMSIGDVFNFKESITYIMLGLGIIMLGVFVIGLRLFLRRNQVVQLQFETSGLRYLSVDWGPRKGRTLFLLVFNQKFTFLPYNEMREVEISESSYFGNSIVIRTTVNTIYLPFFADNKQQMSAIVEQIKGFVTKKESY